MKQVSLSVILSVILVFTLQSHLLGQCYGDFNCDGFVDGSDLARFAESYGSAGCSSWLGSIEGTVQCGTGSPIVGAMVYIPGDSFLSVTDDNGRFKLRAVPDGLYDVAVRVLGKELERVEDVEVASETVTVLDIISGQCNEEVCDGVDNDLDGSIDEDLVAEPCEMQAGVCAGATKSCGGTAGWLACDVISYTNYSTDYEMTEMSCDGQDNDCDGAMDENLFQTCGQSDEGQCQLGFQTCSAGIWGACQGEIGPSPEICDGLDNDCDAQVDEDGVCLRVIGDACTDPSECQSGYCVDGVCCEASCSEICEACSASKTGGSDGICSVIVSGTDPEDDCAIGSCYSGSCLKDPGDPCGSPGECGSGICDGNVCS